MSKRTANALRYKYPLPVHPLVLPELIVHNPISWAVWLYQYVRQCNALAERISVTITPEGNAFPHIEVRDPTDMMYLWDNGFFGTGQLSRSEPTWFERKQLELSKDIVGGGKQLSLEQITRSRRQQRQEFKQQREKVEAELLALRQQGVITPEEEAKVLEREREKLRAYRESHSSLKELPGDDTSLPDDIFDDEGNLRRLEALELLPVEALFLTYALPILDISPKELIDSIISSDDPAALDRLLMHYAAYHHYRSQGWCVRSGIKFGCDYILYKRGPPFQHAEFCVQVLDSEDSKPYTWYASTARVCGGASKTLILCYVTRNSSPEQTRRWAADGKLADVLSSMSVGEVVYRRWVPGRNRD